MKRWVFDLLTCSIICAKAWPGSLAYWMFERMLSPKIQAIQILMSIKSRPSDLGFLLSLSHHDFSDGQWIHKSTNDPCTRLPAPFKRWKSSEPNLQCFWGFNMLVMWGGCTNQIHLSEAFLSTCPIWSAWPLRSLCLCELRVSKIDALGEALAAAGPKVLRDVAAIYWIMPSSTHSSFEMAYLWMGLNGCIFGCLFDHLTCPSPRTRSFVLGSNLIAISGSLTSISIDYQASCWSNQISRWLKLCIKFRKGCLYVSTSEACNTWLWAVLQHPYCRHW